MMNNLSQTLFFSIQKDDYETALAVLGNGANPNTIFEYEKGHHLSSLQLCIQKCSEYGAKKGPANSLYKNSFNVLKSILKKSPNSIICKCLKQHKCPLFTALKAFKITSEQDILQNKCQLVRYLIVNGATIRFQPKQDEKARKIIKDWGLRWFDFQGIRAYLITKQCMYVETKPQIHVQ